MTLDDLIKKAQEYNPQLKTDLIVKAYQFANTAHVGQKRLNGESMIHHTLTTAQILTDLKVDSYTLAAALLHDVVEHSNVEKSELQEEFGEVVAELVDGVSILKKYKTKSGQAYQVENLRKLLLATAKDVRVVLIRLAEKLHSLQSLEGLPESLREETVKKAFEIYAPLAERIGVHHLKWQIEDWAFKHQNHAVHSLIQKDLAQTREAREQYIEQVKTKIQQQLDQEGIKAIIQGRPKHIYSIYKKMLRERQSGESEQEYLARLHDKQALRVLVDTIDDCYKSLGMIHQCWRPTNRFFDYIASPKPNGYRSLHTCVYGDGGKIIEFQIRTHKMHEYNEFGPASHVYYKEVGKREVLPTGRFAWLKNLVEWQAEIPKDNEFEKALKIDVFGDRVFVFTPKGDILDLAQGATPVDFAYAVHSEVGNRCIGAKVDGKLVTLNYALQNGEVCEILVSKREKGPSRDWLSFVKTSTAQHQINKCLRKIET